MSQPLPRRDFKVVDAVIVPRRSRLRTGFHRVGLVAAVPFVLLGLVAIGVGLFGNPSVPAEAIGWGVGAFLCAGVVYVLCRTLAWVIAGFLGD